MQEGGAATRVAEDVQRSIDLDATIAGEENLVQQEAQSDDDLRGRIDGVEQSQYQETLGPEAGPGCTALEQRVVGETQRAGQIEGHD